jgi:hypothetical protein
VVARHGAGRGGAPVPGGFLISLIDG